MARVGDVNHPLYPVWPIRPVDKVEPKKQPPERSPGRSREDPSSPDRQGVDDDSKPRIDDYA